VRVIGVASEVSGAYMYVQVMWLSGLHIPESYLTAIVQATCRRNGWPLDKSTLFTEVTRFTSPDELLDSEDAYGYFVHGLYLEGAGWSLERSCLVKQKPKQLVQVTHTRSRLPALPCGR